MRAELRAEISTANMMGVLSIASSSFSTGESRTDFSTGHWKVINLNQVTKYQFLVTVSTESHSRQEVLSIHQGVLDKVQGDEYGLHPEHCDEVHSQEPDEVRGELFVERGVKVRRR